MPRQRSSASSEPLPDARVLHLRGGDDGDPLSWLPLGGFADKSWGKERHDTLPYRVGEALRSGTALPALSPQQMTIMKDCMQSLATSRD